MVRALAFILALIVGGLVLTTALVRAQGRVDHFDATEAARRGAVQAFLETSAQLILVTHARDEATQALQACRAFPPQR